MNSDDRPVRPPPDPDHQEAVTENMTAVFVVIEGVGDRTVRPARYPATLRPLPEPLPAPGPTGGRA